MNYAAVRKTDIANGPGVRVSLFVSGCRNRCRGCFNPETWSFSSGQPFTRKTEDEILEALRPSWIQGFSVLGGEPCEPENEAALIPLLRRIRSEFPGKDIWLYSGYTYEQLRDREILKLSDVLVDGPFIEAEKDICLPFRGSRNQRILPLVNGRRRKDCNEDSNTQSASGQRAEARGIQSEEAAETGRQGVRKDPALD